jgi:16S rRNA (uracil1498-N3)-methyltransferase
VSLHRFFLTGPLPDAAAQGTRLALSETDLHHLARVLRLEPGDRVMVAGVDGREAEATLSVVTHDAVTADLDAPVVRPARPHVSLAAGIARRERMEFAIQKSTELGVAEVLPVATARTVVRLDEEQGGNRGRRWRRIAQEAAKQSQRTDVPIVRDPLAFSELLAELGRFDVVLVPWEEAGSEGLGIGAALDAAGATPETSVLVVIGPEGGLEEDEVAALEAAGGAIVTLGDTVLRTETASVVAVALATYELGGLGGRVL